MAGRWSTVLVVVSLSLSTAFAENEAKSDEVPLQIELPRSPFYSYQAKTLPAWVKLEERSHSPRKLMLVPKDVSNVALHKPVTSSDQEPIVGELKMVTDGKKELWLQGNTYSSHSLVELGPGRQYVQVNLEQPCEIFAIVFWLPTYMPQYVYRALVVQVAEDAEFKKGVKTLLNTDRENMNGLGAGEDLDSEASYEGRLVDGRRTVAQYVRVYSHGSNVNEMNSFVEVEVYGRPVRAKAP